MNTLLGIALATGSLLMNPIDAQKLVDTNTGVVFQQGTGCQDFRLIAGHNYLELGKRVKLLGIGDKVKYGSCKYTVKNRKVVKRVDYRFKPSTGQALVQTCRGKNADYILLLTLENHG